MDEIKTFTQNLSSIYVKRHYHLFKILEANPDIISKLARLYLQNYKTKDNETVEDISSLLALIIANYHEHINKGLKIKDGD